jgi:IS30 family transposase
MGNQYKQLTIKERYQIEAFCTLGFSARKMATELGRSNKTISRELALCPDDKYCAEMSHQQVHLRRRDAAKYHKCSAILKEVIRPLLVLGLSPEQIAGRMNIETVSNYLSCNTIYTLVKREQWQHLLARKVKSCKKT